MMGILLLFTLTMVALASVGSGQTITAVVKPLSGATPPVLAIPGAGEQEFLNNPWDDAAVAVDLTAGARRTSPRSPVAANFGGCNIRKDFWKAAAAQAQTYTTAAGKPKYANFGQLFDDITTPLTPATAPRQPVYKTVRFDATAKRYVSNGTNNIPVPYFIASITVPSMPRGRKVPDLTVDLRFDFAAVNWEGSNNAPKTLNEEWCFTCPQQFFPRYPTYAAAAADPDRFLFERIWPKSPTISVKYKRMGYDTAGTGYTLAAVDSPMYARGLKYSLNVVAAGNIDVTSADSGGSVTGSTTNTYDRQFNAKYLQGTPAAVAGRMASYAASHSLGDKSGGPAKYFNLSPLSSYINGRGDFMSVLLGGNPWRVFEDWVATEARLGVSEGSLVYVMHKFLYCDTQDASTGLIDMAPKVVLFYAYSTRLPNAADIPVGSGPDRRARAKWGFVTNWPDPVA